MGIGIVLIVYFFALSVLAAGCSLVFGLATRWYLRGTVAGRTRLVVLAAVFPFLCVAYAGAWFVAYAFINDTVFHHDPMLGDGWYTNIPNGYAIDMIDVTDQGTVHPTSGPDNGLNNPEGVSGVRRMQVSGNYIFGAEDKNWFGDLGKETASETGFFAIDTRTRAKKDFVTEDELRAYARSNGTTLALQPVVDVYRSYRMNWFEPAAGLVFVLVPGAALFWLVHRIVLLKRLASRDTTGAAA